MFGHVAWVAEKKMLGRSSVGSNNENLMLQQSGNPTLALETQISMDGPLNPPIITHTAATPMGTPMATPQGSPNESSLKDNNKLTVSISTKRNSLTVEGDRSAVS
jgi:hypothetical protein